MKRLGRIFLGSLATMVVLYSGDWTILQVRGEHGTSSVQVEQFLKTPLKGRKEEFDYMGTVAQPCVRSIFPHRAQKPCWWLQGHRTQWVSP